ncbi:MAG: hypothetical protein R2747_16500 [Pyrinomonadaceae bacterium]
MAEAQPDSRPDKQKNRTDSERALLTLLAVMGGGILGTLIFALQAAGPGQFFAVAGVGIMVAGSSLLIGGMLGFLFGIPRTLQQNEPVEIPGNDQAENGEQPINYRANTNLEQISDWLTKILVGVGLTQITVIPEKLNQISAAVADGLGNAPGSRVFALASIVFFVICGFLFGYLWTRLFLPGAFRRADLSALASQVDRTNKEVKQVNQKLAELKKQSELDALALNTIGRQLNPSADIPAPSQEQINEAVGSASRPVRVQIFSQAQLLRSDNWKDNKSKMELVIPIFKALIECDTKREYHRTHGQLGFALKDKAEPDWAGAETELTTAIEMRGPWEENGYLFYEFNRAFCRIMQDAEFRQDLPSKPDSRKMILEDLQAAAQSELRKLILSDSEIKKWMSLNKVTSKNLR